MTPESVLIPRVFLRPLPLRVSEHPERSARAKVTLVREMLVGLSVNHPPIMTAIQTVTEAPWLGVTIDGYRRAADKAATVVGLANHRELLTREDGPLSVRFD